MVKRNFSRKLVDRTHEKVNLHVKETCSSFLRGFITLTSCIINIYDMVWKPFVLGDCVPSAGSRLKNPSSFYCLTIVSSESLAKGMGTKYLFCLPGLYLTAYFANNEVLPPFFDGECLCYIVWSILID